MRYFFLLSFLACVAGMSGGCSSPAGSPAIESSSAPAASAIPPTPHQLFATYLHDTFSHTIPATGEHWYVIIPAAGCLGCAHAELRYLAGTPWAPAVTVVTSGLLRDLSKAEQTSLARHTQLLADTFRVADNTLDRISLPFSSLTGLVRTRDGQVVEFVNFDKDTYQSVLATLPKSRP